MVNYRGYLIHFRSEVLRGALWQRPLLPSFLFFLAEHPGYFFRGTRPWQRLGSRLTTCCWIRKNPGVGFGRRLSFSRRSVGPCMEKPRTGGTETGLLRFLWGE